MTIKRYTYLIIYIIASVFFAACTSEEEQDPNGYGKNIKAKVSLATRATGTPEDAANNQELINDWWVLFVNSSNEIVKYIDRHSTTGASTAVEREEFDLEIATGDYTAYSFANITKTQVETAINTSLGGTHSLTAGQTMPDLTNVTFDVSSFNGANVPPTTNIPMTGKQNVRFASGGMQFIELEVVRMVAKMEFKFTNESSKPLTINSLTMNRVENPNVRLLPNYTWLESGWTFATSKIADAAPFVRTYSSPPTISLEAKGGSKTTDSDKFYMIESQADFDTPSQSYLMTLNVTRDGGSPENLYFMLDKTTNDKRLQTIYRNDHVIVPLTITDYTIGLDASNYPPIGGYPQATVTSDDDLQSFYCTFGTQGVFCIKPTVYSTSTGANLMYGAWIYEGSFTFDGNTDIFVKDSYSKPDLTIDPSTGEIVGKLTTETGTACITIQVKVVSTGQVYTRHIYIIRA